MANEQVKLYPDASSLMNSNQCQFQEKMFIFEQVDSSEEVKGNIGVVDSPPPRSAFQPAAQHVVPTLKHCYVRPIQAAQSDIYHIQCHLKGTGSVLAQSAQDDSPVGGTQPTGSQSPSVSPGETVGVGQHSILGHQCPTTHVTSIHLYAHHPRPHASRRHRASPKNTGCGVWRGCGAWRGWGASTSDALVSVSPSRCEGDEARLVGGDYTVDPGLIAGHSGEDCWEIRLSTTNSKTHHSCLDPAAVLLTHYRPTRVALRREEHLGAGNLCIKSKLRQTLMKWPEVCTLACQGQLPSGATCPPTILVLSGAVPHAEERHENTPLRAFALLSSGLDVGSDSRACQRI
ncbi:hypothetical protein INR49_017943 [Caranx melampygus]|nr:hypothetical protein INR49_017943 [Caranx melampygus]